MRTYHEIQAHSNLFFRSISRFHELSTTEPPNNCAFYSKRPNQTTCPVIDCEQIELFSICRPGEEPKFAKWSSLAPAALVLSVSHSLLQRSMQKRLCQGLTKSPSRNQYPDAEASV